MMLTKRKNPKAFIEIDILISKNLKAKRIELGVTRKDLAGLVGISVQQLQKYEKGTNRISSGKLFAFAQYLKVPIGYFFE